MQEKGDDVMEVFLLRVGSIVGSAESVQHSHISRFIDGETEKDMRSETVINMATDSSDGYQDCGSRTR